MGKPGWGWGWRLEEEGGGAEVRGVVPGGAKPGSAPGPPAGGRFRPPKMRTGSVGAVSLGSGYARTGSRSHPARAFGAPPPPAPPFSSLPQYVNHSPGCPAPALMWYRFRKRESFISGESERRPEFLEVGGQCPWIDVRVSSSTLTWERRVGLAPEVGAETRCVVMEERSGGFEGR